jgi:hypothetical protein
MAVALPIPRVAPNSTAVREPLFFILVSLL